MVHITKHNLNFKGTTSLCNSSWSLYIQTKIFKKNGLVIWLLKGGSRAWQQLCQRRGGPVVAWWFGGGVEEDQRHRHARCGHNFDFYQEIDGRRGATHWLQLPNQEPLWEVAALQRPKAKHGVGVCGETHEKYFWSPSSLEPFILKIQKWYFEGSIFLKKICICR
jgi:hypothetical protein